MYYQGRRCMVLCMALLFASMGAFAATITFTDATLEQAVRDWFFSHGSPLGGTIDSADLVDAGFESFDASGLGINSLEGLEYATDLTSLNIFHNNISDLGPLASLVQLEELRAGYNQISDLTPLQNLTSLTYLDLGIGHPDETEDDFFGLLTETGTNQVTDLSPLTNLTGMTYLNVAGNAGIDSLAVFSALTNLEMVVVTNSSVTDFSPLSNLDALQFCILAGNDLQDSQVGYIGGLTNLMAVALAHEHSLTDLSPLSTLNPMMAFFVDVPVTDFSFMAGYTNLQNAGFIQSGITAAPDLSACSPESLSFFNNGQLTDISGLSGVTSLMGLELAGSPVSDISALAGLTNLEYLTLESNQISDIQGLLDNTGLGGDDQVSLLNNPLSGPSPSAACDQLPEFIARFNNPDNVQTNAVCGNVVVLTINVEGSGSGMTMPDPGQTVFPMGQDAFLLAVPFPDSGTSFAGWSGDLVSDSPFATIHMDGDKTVTATFADTGDHTLTISGGGPAQDLFTSIPFPGAHLYADGQTAHVVTTQDDGGYFAGWTGDVISSSPYIEFTMDGDRTIIGNMENEGYRLEVRVRGKGRTSILPLPFFEVEFQIATGMTVPIEAIPWDAEWEFDRWEGDIGSNDPNTADFQAVMDQDRTITAVFAPVNADFALTLLDSQGGGALPQNSEGFTDPPSGAYGYNDGEQVAVEAIPVVGYAFVAWEGDVLEENRTDNPLTVTMDQDRTLQPVFVPEGGHTLTLTTAGAGNIEVGDGGVQVGPQSWVFPNGQGVQLLAVCDSDTALEAWSGDIGYADAHSRRIYLQMDQDRAVTATFTAADFTLTLTLTGAGNLDPAPGQYGFLTGTWVNLNASLISNSGYAFEGWQGDAGTSSNLSFGLTMDADKAVEAVFVTPGQFTLTMGEPQGWGGSNPSPGVYSYLSGQTARIQAYSSSNAYFAGWSGSISDQNPTVNITMDGNKSVAPMFNDSGYTLTLNIGEGGWINDYGTGNYYFANGLTPTLVASPQYGYGFLEWQGDLPAGANAADPELAVPMTQDRNLTALFTSTTYPLTINAQGGGTTNPAPGTYLYAIGSTQYIFASPAPGGSFIGWQGDIGSADPSSTVLELAMDQPKTVTAVFQNYNGSLTVNVSGVGNASPMGTTYYFTDTVVYLKAIPQADSGYAFNQWTGDISSTDMMTAVTIDGDMTVTAEFTTPGDYTLTVGVGGNAGTSTVDMGTGDFSFMNGQEFTLTAEPAPRHSFVQWEGDIDPGIATTPTVTIMMDQDRTLTAVFEEITYRNLTIELEGTGQTSPPPGTYEYVDGNRVVVFATEEVGSGFLFDKWEGDIGDNDPHASSVAFDIYENRTIRAIFRLGDWTLNMAVRGGGTTNPEPGAYSYLDEDTAQFQAVAHEGYVFTGWEGDIGDADPHLAAIELSMVRDRNVTAVFEPAESILCQLMAPEKTPFVSSAGIDYFTFDSFENVTDPIVGLWFWGFGGSEVGGVWGPCDRGPNDFEVIFYADNGSGEPGQIVYQEQFFGVQSVDTGQNFFSYDIMEYSVTFTQPQTISSGWLSVRGITDESCWFLWSGSGDGDNSCLQYSPDELIYKPKTNDVAFCFITFGDEQFHTADVSHDMKISLTELLRVIQFFNMQGLHCQAGTEDGYGPGPGEDHACRPHASDYNPQDWKISLTELLRLIQFFNLGGYYVCPGQDTEDGFCVPLGV